jgi:hypothetical protein
MVIVGVVAEDPVAVTRTVVERAPARTDIPNPTPSPT